MTPGKWRQYQCGKLSENFLQFRTKIIHFTRRINSLLQKLQIQGERVQVISGIFFVDKRQLRIVDGILAIISNACPPSKIREIVAPKACIHFLYSFWNGNLRGADAFFGSFFHPPRKYRFRRRVTQEPKQPAVRAYFGRAKACLLFCIVVTVIFAAPRRLLEWGIQEEVCCDWLNAFKECLTRN